MRKIFNEEMVYKAVEQLLLGFGEDLNDENIKETPKRVTKYWKELLEGEQYTNDEIAAMFDKQFGLPTTNNMVVLTDIPIFSHCCHHLALMFNMKVHVAYIPKDRVIGLSKIPRIVDMVSKRLQLQERLCEDISYILQKLLDTANVAVVIEGEHGCVAARGIKKNNCKTLTEVMNGDFKTNAMLAERFYNLIERGN